MEQKINNLLDTSVQNTDLNMTIDVINNGIEIINKLKEKRERDQQVSVLILNLQHFTEHVEDIGLGIQMTRLGLFYPKLFKHDYLKNMNAEKVLKIKTSTWLKKDTNEILIISHIPSEIVKSPVFDIIHYPDENNNILTENLLDKYFLYEYKVFHKETGKIVIDDCINGIIRQENTECRYTKTYKNFQINYVEPNILLTWNIPKTSLSQN